MNGFQAWSGHLPELRSRRGMFLVLLAFTAFGAAWLLLTAIDRWWPAYSGLAQVLVLVLGYANVAQFFKRRIPYQERWGDQAYRRAFKLHILTGLLWVLAAITHTIRLPGENVFPGWAALPVEVLGWYFCLTGISLDLRAIQVLGWDTLALVYVYSPKDSRMVSSSIYEIIRHPVYSAVVRITLALALWRGTWFSLGFGLALPVAFYYFWLRRVEEPDLLERFGDSYGAYRQKTPAFWPRPKDWLKFWRFLVLGR